MFIFPNEQTLVTYQTYRPGTRLQISWQTTIINCRTLPARITRCCPWCKQVKSKVSAATSHSDIVYAYPSASWPTSAQTWITRTREAKWPNNVLMKQILSNGVHYVKKCPKEIQYTHLAPYFWRISFSLAERDLARHFNETQR